VKPADISGINGREYPKDKINELATNSKNKNIRDQPRNNLAKDGNFLADSHSILNRWKNYFSQLLNVHNVGQIEVHTAEPLVPGPSRLEVKLLLQS
jgi:hypothetical protein